MISLALLLTLPAVAQSAVSEVKSVSESSKVKSSHTHSVPGASAVHNSAIVIDTHADTPGRFVDDLFDPATGAGKGHWDLTGAKAANLGAEFFSVWVDPVRYKDHYARRALDMIDSVHQAAQQHPHDLIMAYSAKEILAAREGTHKRIAALIGIEGGHAIEGDIRVLRDFYRLGARYMTLTWANSNELGQSSGDVKEGENGKPKDPGLTDFGRDVVREMNRLGMMVDISHVSDRSFYQALVVSRAPVIASHSSSRAMTNHPRNMTDDMLIALARNGGVAQVNFNCGFISDEYNANAKAYEEAHPAEIKRAQELWLAPKTPESRAGHAGGCRAASSAQRADRPLRSHDKNRGSRARRHRLGLRWRGMPATGNRRRAGPSQDHRRAPAARLQRRRAAQSSRRQSAARLG